MKKAKIYATILEPEALEQFKSAMNNEWVVQGALLPDAHLGYSLPIGAVISTKDVIVPAWVGYDIGCGMCALPTTYNKSEIMRNKKSIFNNIHSKVPIGFQHHKAKQSLNGLNVRNLTELGRMMHNSRKGDCSFGTLGGG
jgi:tRNA-splicing ligase RtcB (3'-phosphate/5'-hydroxy nucleic acid ligase)